MLRPTRPVALYGGDDALGSRRGATTTLGAPRATNRGSLDVSPPKASRIAAVSNLERKDTIPLVALEYGLGAADSTDASVSKIGFEVGSSASGLGVGPRESGVQSALVKSTSKEATLSELIGVIHDQHQKIQKLGKRVTSLSLKAEDASQEEASIHALLHRCSEAAHILWSRNQKKEEEIIKLKEKLQNLREQQNPSLTKKKPVCHRSRAEELRPHLWLMNTSNDEQ